MSPAELREAARRIVERSTREQGLPLCVEDEAVLARVARELRAARVITLALGPGPVEVEGAEGGGAADARPT